MGFTYHSIKMKSLTSGLLFAFISLFPSCDGWNYARNYACRHTHCPKEDNALCAFILKDKTYKIFAGRCAMAQFMACNGYEIHETPLSYCINNDYKKNRRMYGDGESCPVFCPTHYRPVCGASKIRDYVYRTFTNGCQLDMLNCRGDDDVSGYVEVPLSFCPNHYMKNIFKDQIVSSNLPEYHDYDH